VRKTPHPLLKAIGKHIRAARKTKGWSQEHLAAEAGIDRSYMSGIERPLTKNFPDQDVWSCGIARTDWRSRLSVDEDLLFAWYWAALKRLKAHFDPLLPPP